MNTLIVGLGFGDEGKGSWTDFLVRDKKATCVVRYNGGAQAAHNVVTEDGRHHTFSQFGSGTFVAGVKTFLSRHVLVNPLAMIEEDKALKKVRVSDAMERMHIDERALVTTPYHRALNRLREISRQDGNHGSCGMGVGETIQDFMDRGEEVIRVSDLLWGDRLTKKLYATHVAMIEKVRALDIERVRNNENTAVIDHEMSTFDVPTASIIRAYRRFRERVSVLNKDHAGEFLREHKEIVFEGAQGVLLDEKYGFHPYTTWSNTTSANAHQIINEFDIGSDNDEEIGVVRAFMTRHGKGPFVTETDEIKSAVNDDHNRHGAWQGAFRTGWFDAAMLKYALRVNGAVDAIAITHADKLFGRNKMWPMCYRYDFEPEPGESLAEQTLLCARLFTASPQYEPVRPDEVVDWIAKKAGTPNAIITSRGPTCRDKRQFLC